MINKIMQTKRVFIKENMTVCNPFFYVIYNENADKFYAGYKSHKKTCNSDTFMTRSGYCTSSKEIAAIINRDGIHDFKVVRIRHFQTKEEAIEYEAKFLKHVNAKHNMKFYNMSNGDGKFFMTHEANERRRLKSIGRKHSKETIKKMKNHRHSDESKSKQRAAKLGRKLSEETKNKLRNVKRTQFTRDKLKAAWKTRKLSDLELQNRGAARVGCKWWNDGVNNKFCKSCPGDGWMIGMVFKPRRKIK
jgi:hypothetical protein